MARKVIIYIVVMAGLLLIIGWLDGTGTDEYEDEVDYLEEYDTSYEDDDAYVEEDAAEETTDYGDTTEYDGICDICGDTARYQDGVEEFCISCYADEIEESDEVLDDEYDDLEDY